MSKDEALFLALVHDPARTPALLARLEAMGLLASFLEAERGA